MTRPTIVNSVCSHARSFRVSAATPTLLLTLVVLGAGVGGLLGRDARLAVADDPATEPPRYLAYDQSPTSSEAQSDIWIANLQGASRRLIARNGSWPEISPDGRWVAFRRTCDTRDRYDECDGVWLIQTDGASEHRVLLSARVVAWTPDSKNLLVYRGKSSRQRNALALVDLDGNLNADISQGADRFGGAAISPDGASVAYVKQAGTRCGAGRTNVFIYDVASRATRQVTRDGRSLNPLILDDGIAFTRRPPGCGSSKLSAPAIWSVGRDGTRLRRIMGAVPSGYRDFGYYGLRPLASVGGTTLLLVGVMTEWGDIPLRLDMERRSLRPILDQGRPVRGLYVAASRDGSRILTAEGGIERPQSIVELPISGGAGRQVLYGWVGWPSWNR